MFRYYTPDGTLWSLSIVRWMVSYGLFLFGMILPVQGNRGFEQVAPIMALPVAAVAYWVAVHGINRLLCMNARGREYVLRQEQAMRAIRERVRASGDTTTPVVRDGGELAALTVLWGGALIALMVIVQYFRGH